MSSKSSSAKSQPQAYPTQAMVPDTAWFLSEARTMFLSSLDYEETLATVAGAMVPRLADWCFLHILDPDGTPKLQFVSQSDPKKVMRTGEVEQDFPFLVDNISIATQCRCPVFVEGDSLRAKGASWPGSFPTPIDFRSVQIVPLIARNTVLGTLTLASGSRYTENERSLALELAEYAAIAIDNARRHRELQETIRTKDESLTLLHEALQQLPAGVILSRAPDGEILYQNQAALELWGLETEGSRPRTEHATLLTEEHGLLTRVLKTGEVQTEEFEIRRADGERAFIRAKAGPVRDRDGNVTAAVAAVGDVTRRWLGEIALRESEEKFRSLAEVAPCSIFIHDGEGLLYVNRATCDSTGYTREELLSAKLLDLLHPESVPRIRERIRLQKEGKPVPSHFEERIVCKDRSEKWIKFNSATFQYEGRQAVICIAMDITERRRTQEQLHLSQERVRLASEAAGISSWEWNMRSNQVIWSSEVDRTLGFEQESHRSASFNELLSRIHHEDRHRVREVISRSVTEHNDFSVEFRMRRAGGDYGWVSTRAKIFYDDIGQPERMVGIGIDITSNKLSDEALRLSEERFRMTFNQAAVGMAQAAPDGTLIMVNHRFAEILGYSEEELLGRKFHEFTHPDDLTKCVEQLDAMLIGNLPSCTLEKRYLRPDGTQVWTQVSSSLVRDDETHEPKYMIAVVEDITERRRAAEALRNSERLAATGRLAASIAHEINNPLEAVTNLLYLLDQNKSLDESARGFTTMAQEEISRVAHIARQTLGFYRDSSRVEAVHVGRLLDEVIGLFARKIRTHEVTLVKELEADPAIEAFPGELRQVISNLIANALDAIGRGGRLHIRVKSARNPRNLTQHGVRLLVGDNGPGIAKADRTQIFEPFFTTKGVKGTGLGLWVTRGIVEKHGGTIRVRSCCYPGSTGTVFSVFFPANQTAKSLRYRLSDTVGA